MPMMCKLAREVIGLFSFLIFSSGNINFMKKCRKIKTAKMLFEEYIFSQDTGV
jgi:hypothetical protein